jgi:C4-type Zn-finger protein
MDEADSTTCPVCGEGTLRTIDFRDQQPESRQVETFTCGHEVAGARLQTADSASLDVEQRTSEETVTPIDPQA